MATLPKVFAILELQRLEAISESGGLRATTQAGFRKDARAEDNLLLLITTIQRAVDLKEPAYLLFIDLAKAYDTVDRGLLWQTML
jgi:hypothetical protein